MANNFLHTIPLWPLDASLYCTCPKGASCGRSAGKHPRISNWTDVDTHTRTAPREFVEGLRSVMGRGEVPAYGIICGEVNDLVVVDIDPRNDIRTGPSCGLETWEEWGAPMDLAEENTVRTPGGGFHIYFSWKSLPEELRKSCKLGVGVDFLSDGRYVVGPGCMQANGKQYLARKPNGDRMPEPPVHGGGLRLKPCPAWLVKLLEGVNSRPKTKDKGAVSGGAGELEKLGEVLRWLDGHDFDEWVKTGLAIHHTFYGTEHEEDAYQVWLAWSRTFSSFVGDRDCRDRWDSMKVREGGLGFGSLVHWAREAGMKSSPVLSGAGEVNVGVRAELTETNLQSLDRMRWQNTYTGPFADHDVVFPGYGFGLMNRLVKLSVKHSPQPDELISLAGAIAYFGAFFSRRWKYGGMDTRMYMIMAAPSGAGKGSVESVISGLHKHTGMMLTLRGSPLRSDSGMFGMLAEYPRRLVTWDEFGDHMAAINAGKKTGGNSNQLEAMVKEAYSTENLSMGGTAKRRAQLIMNPAMSIMGTTTRAALEDALTLGQFTGGLMGRFLIFIKPEDSRLEYIKSIDELEKEKDLSEFGRELLEIEVAHLQRLNKVAELSPVAVTSLNLSDIQKLGNPDESSEDDFDLEEDIFNSHSVVSGFRETADVSATWMYVDGEEPANEFMRSIQDRLIDWRNDGAGVNEVLCSFWNRFPLQVKKLGLIAALCDNPMQPVVKLAHVRWAFQLVLYCYTVCSKELFEPVVSNGKKKSAAHGAGGGYDEDLFTQIAAWCVDAADDSDCVSARGIYSKWRRAGKKVINEALGDMLTVGLLDSRGNGTFFVDKKEISEYFGKPERLSLVGGDNNEQNKKSG